MGCLDIESRLHVELPGAISHPILMSIKNGPKRTQPSGK